MEGLRDKTFYALMGASGGLSGVPANCSGGACGACTGCLYVLAAILFAALLTRKGENNAVA